MVLVRGAKEKGEVADESLEASFELGRNTK